MTFLYHAPSLTHNLMQELKLLLIIIIANGAPIIAHWLFKSWYAFPLDFGVHFTDGKPLFGSSKTIRGIFFAMVFSIIVAIALGFSWEIGLIIGAVAMLGDLFSSFIKRRLGLKPSSQAIGLDQIPESLFPLLAVSPIIGLEWQQILKLVFIFFVFELVFSRLLYRFNIRKRPY